MGFVALLVGVLDPLEGSIVILAGSALVALGTFLGPSERRWIVYRAAVFALIAAGVGALFGLSTVGLGPGGLSMWWGLLALPYLIGWTMAIWGPDSPRWVLWGGLVVGVACLALASQVLGIARMNQRPATIGLVLIGLAVVTLGGCAYRMWRRGRG